jgi:hypothetical protein
MCGIAQGGYNSLWGTESFKLCDASNDSLEMQSILQFTGIDLDELDVPIK